MYFRAITYEIADRHNGDKSYLYNRERNEKESEKVRKIILHSYIILKQET